MADDDPCSITDCTTRIPRRTLWQPLPPDGSTGRWTSSPDHQALLVHLATDHPARQLPKRVPNTYGADRPLPGGAQ